MARKNEVIWFDRGIFPVSLGFCPSKKAWKKMLRSLGMPKDIEYPDVGAGSCIWLENFETGDDYVLVCIPSTQYDKTYKTDSDSRTLVDGLIVHEVTHMFDYVCQSMKEEKPSSEFRSYSVQTFFQNVRRAYENSLVY